jgi:hypothetical protein
VDCPSVRSDGFHCGFQEFAFVFEGFEVIEFGQEFPERFDDVLLLRHDCHYGLSQLSAGVDHFHL